jgi:hypothetical protein
VPALVLGPALRYVDETDATVWVETDGPCTVEVLGHEARTFRVCGTTTRSCTSPASSRARRRVRGHPRRRAALARAGSPFPPSVIRTPHDHREAQIVFGSCRVAVPHEPPYTLRKDEDDRAARSTRCARWACG